MRTLQKLSAWLVKGYRKEPDYEGGFRTVPYQFYVIAGNHVEAAKIADNVHGVFDIEEVNRLGDAWVLPIEKVS